MAGAACYALLLAVAVVPAGQALTEQLAIRPAPVGRLATWSELPQPVVAYAQQHSVYIPQHGALGSPKMWQTQPHVIDLLAAGQRPDALIDALERREFDAVMPFNVSDPQLEYVGMAGHSSPGDLLRLNRLIDAGYAPGAGGAPAPLWGRLP